MIDDLAPCNRVAVQVCRAYLRYDEQLIGCALLLRGYYGPYKDHVDK